MPRSQSRAAEERSNELVWTRDASSVILPSTTSAELINFTDRLEVATGDNARNWTIERIIGNFTFTVPAATAAGRSYFVATAIDVGDSDLIAGGNMPEPFSDFKSFPWVDGRRVFADHTVPASYASPGINGQMIVDMRSKRRARGFNEELVMFGYHDNGLSANPVMYYAYSALWRLRA